MEGVGIVACFIGVILIALGGEKKEELMITSVTGVVTPGPVDEITIAEELAEDTAETGPQYFGGNENAMRILGVVLMLFVAFNDASLNVMARTMKDLHFSVIQFWLGAIGVAILIVYLTFSCAISGSAPDIVQYDLE